MPSVSSGTGRLHRSRGSAIRRASNVPGAVRPQEGGLLTAQGHPRAIYQRAIERGNLLVAETTLRELGRPTLGELLELTILIAFKDPRRYPRVSARWLVRYLEAHGEATIDDATFAVAFLEALAGPNNLHAVTALRDMASSGRRFREGRPIDAADSP
jgi:hypothetical protein